MRIAVIELNREKRKDLVELLNQHRCIETVFRAVYEFVEHVVQNETTSITDLFDLAIMDMEIPDVSDAQVIATLTRIFPKFPIIRLTDEITKYFQGIKRHHSHIDILQKPFTFVALERGVEQALPKTRQESKEKEAR